MLGEGGSLPGRHARRLHHFLGKSLGAFQTGSCCPGTEDGEAAIAQLVGKAGDKRSLGADHGEIDPLALDEGYEGRDVLGTDIHGGGIAFDARIAGRTEEPPDPGTPGQASDERMLAGASSDHQDVQPVRSHGLLPCLGSRRAS